ncbi:MAG: Rieske (2Fe-2S) protein [Dehalococcoidia bacterium]|nr:Rieske (2Fe-2S) protein [Dehalococcoidia bacterium]
MESRHWLHAGSAEELARQGCRVVTGAGHAVAVFAHEGRFYALDNRCPHMGFPLAQGTVQDGLLICHWHHARFDLASGDTFDLFAGDIPRFETRTENGEVYVAAAAPERGEAERWSRRLDEALEHNVRLVIARSIIGMMNAGADYRDALRKGALFGMRNSARGWDSALTILTICANLQPWLGEDDRPLAMYQGLLHVADETAGRAPRFPIEPLGAGVDDPARLKEWLRRFVNVRDAEAAERTLRTAIEAGVSREDVADMVFAAITEHLYVDTGHTIDFAMKAFELLEHVGWEHAPLALTSLVPQMISASRSEEQSQWRQPVDVSALVFEARQELPRLREQGRRASAPWDGEDAIVERILSDDPASAIDALKAAVADGASPEQLGAAVAYAAFVRMARFHLSNEFADWNTVHHCVTTANAVHQALRRFDSDDLLRAVFDTAMSVYHARFLNIPSAAIPAPNGKGAGPAETLDGLLQAMDRQQHVDEAGRQVGRYVDSGASDAELLRALGNALLREDSGFHQFQLAEAAFQQYALRRGTAKGRVILIAAARFLSAHSPTVRAAGQTYRTAFRLHRGDQVFQE